VEAGRAAMRDGGSSVASGRLGQPCLLLAHLDVAVVDGAADSVAASGCTRQVELVSRLADMRIVVAPAWIEPFDLTYKLAQQTLELFQAKFEQGNLTLRDIEQTRLDESDKWVAFLDADFALQQGQLSLLQATGQLAKVFQ